jgi:dTDP-4-dehydrorhamnose 3,5-epimerase
MKKSDSGYAGFGEAYFSTIHKEDIKGWKKHTKMTLNLIVILGEVEFVVYNQREKSFFIVRLSKRNYQRLTIKPNLWVAFKGISKNSILLNIADIEHDPNEAINRELKEIEYGW